MDFPAEVLIPLPVDGDHNQDKVTTTSCRQVDIRQTEEAGAYTRPNLVARCPEVAVTFDSLTFTWPGGLVSKVLLGVGCSVAFKP